MATARKNNSSRRVKRSPSTNSKQVQPQASSRDVNRDTKKTTQVYKIFLSHKHSPEDSRVAMLFQKTMESLYGHKLHVFIAEGISEGRNWYDTILEEIQRSSEFILLYSNSADEWNWPMFEAGCFSGFSSNMKPVTVICHKDIEPPSTLFNLQHVRIDSRSRSKSEFKQPKSFFRNLHQRILGSKATDESWRKVVDNAKFQTLCNAIESVVARSPDPGSTSENEVGFVVDLTPRYGRTRRHAETFEPTSVIVNSQWQKRFVGKCDSLLTWPEFLQTANSHIILPPKLGEALSMWALMETDGIREKPLLGYCRTITDPCLLRPIIAQSTRMLNESYRLKILLLRPAALYVDQQSSAPNLFQAELFMARLRSLRYDAIWPSRLWIKQFVARRHLSESMAKLCLSAIDSVLSNIMHEFELRGFCPKILMNLLATANKELAASLFENESKIVLELRSRNETPRFDSSDVNWLSSSLEKLSEVNEKLFPFAIDAFNAALRLREGLQADDSIPPVSEARNWKYWLPFRK